MKTNSKRNPDNYSDKMYYNVYTFSINLVITKKVVLHLNILVSCNYEKMYKHFLLNFTITLFPLFQNKINQPQATTQPTFSLRFLRKYAKVGCN